MLKVRKRKIYQNMKENNKQLIKKERKKQRCKKSILKNKNK